MQQLSTLGPRVMIQSMREGGEVSIEMVVFYTVSSLLKGGPLLSSFDCRRCLRDLGWIGQLVAVLESVHAAAQRSQTARHDTSHERGRGGQRINRLVLYCNPDAEGGPIPSSFERGRGARDLGWIWQLVAVLKSVHAAAQRSQTARHHTSHERGRGGEHRNGRVLYCKLFAERAAITEFV